MTMSGWKPTISLIHPSLLSSMQCISRPSTLPVILTGLPSMTYSTLPPPWTFPPFQPPCHLTLPHTHGTFDPCTLRGISHLSTIHGIGDTQIWQNGRQALMLNHNAPIPVFLVESISLWLKVWWLHESQSHQNDGTHWTMEDGETLYTGHPTIYTILFFHNGKIWIWASIAWCLPSTSRLRLLRQLWLIQQKYR